MWARSLRLPRSLAKVFELEWPTFLGSAGAQNESALGYQTLAGGRRRAWGRIRPDIKVLRGGRVLTVLDTKYKKTPAGMVHNPDVYQVLAYCVAESTPFGALIYPKAEFRQDDEIEIRNSAVESLPIRIRRFAIDLDVPRDRLLFEANGLVDRVAGWIQEIEPTSPVMIGA